MAEHRGDGFLMVDKYIILRVSEYNRLHQENVKLLRVVVGAHSWLRLGDSVSALKRLEEVDI